MRVLIKLNEEGTFTSPFPIKNAPGIIDNPKQLPLNGKHQSLSGLFELLFSILYFPKKSKQFALILITSQILEEEERAFIKFSVRSSNICGGNNLLEKGFLLY